MADVERGTFQELADDLANAFMIASEMRGAFGTPGFRSAEQQLSIAIERAMAALATGAPIPDGPRLFNVTWKREYANGATETDTYILYADDAEAAAARVRECFPPDTLESRLHILQVEEERVDVKGDQNRGAGQLGADNSPVAPDINRAHVCDLRGDARARDTKRPSNDEYGEHDQSEARRDVGRSEPDNDHGDQRGDVSVAAEPKADTATEDNQAPIALQINVFVAHGITPDALRNHLRDKVIEMTAMTDDGPVQLAAKFL